MGILRWGTSTVVTVAGRQVFPWKVLAAVLFALIGIACQPLLGPAPTVTHPHRIGLLSSRSEQPWYQGLSEGMRELGYLEGETLAIEYRYAAGDEDRMRHFLAEFADLGVKAIVATDASSLDAARGATDTIPVVMVL